MTTLPPIPTTRESLMATAYRHTGRLASLVAGATLLSIPAARAVDWNGSVSTDWNTAANWTPAGVPAGANAVIKVSTPNFARISANITSTPVDIFVGLDAGSNARLDHVAGNAGTGAGNWMFVGRNGATGVYNLGDTAGTGGTYTGMATGTGSMNVGGRLYIGGNAGTGSTGTVNVNTTGSLTMGAHLEIGTNTSAGTLNLDAGTVSSGDWLEVGNGTGCSGTLRMSGGTINKGGVNGFIVAANGSTGNATVSGGTINTTVTGANGQFRVGNNTGSNGTLNLSGTGAINVSHEIWVGNNTGATGAMNITGGTVTNSSWVAIGRKDGANAGVGGVGTVTMSAGTWTKTGESNFIVGASGNGTMTMTGGLVSVAASATADRGITWVGETNSCTGVLSLSGTAEWRSPRITMGNVAGATGTLNLDGGIVKAGQITGGAGNANVHFNGTEIIPTANQADFVTNLDVADIKAGHLRVNTNGFNVTIAQVLTAGSAAGGVVKTGAGTLTLSGANSHTGDHTITAGKLVVTDSATGGGSFTVANGATFGVTQTVDSDSLDAANVTFGNAGASSLDINLGSISGNPSAPPLNVTGALTLNGTVTLNVADALPAVGTVPLISYVSPKGGSGSFVLGTLPNGVVAHLVDNGSQVSLEIESVSLPLWDGSVDGKWDTTTQNWIDRATGLPTTYANPAPVRFDDDASGTTAITLNQTVSPSKVTFDNTNHVYGITGSGKITGTTGVTKAGTAGVTLGTPNDFTGPVSISGGTLTATTLANGGSPSAIGASTAAPSNLVLEGGTLGYTGPSTATDRGFTINAVGSGISTASDLSLTGTVNNVNGTFLKKGAGNLTFSQNSVIGLGTVNPSLQVQEGTLTFSGAGSQVVNVAGEFQGGSVPDLPANIVLQNTSLVTTGFIALSRGQGNDGVTNFTATNSTIQSVNFSTGYNNALANNASEAFVTLNNTTWTNAGLMYLAESTGAAGTMTLNGTSVLNGAGNILLGRNAGTTAVLTLKDTSSVNKTAGYTGVGAGGNGTLNVQDSASFTSNVDDFNVGDGANATGALNLSGSGTVSVAQVYIGKNTGTNGTVTQTGGTFQSSTFITIGRFSGGNGVTNVSGGTFSQNGTANVFYVAQEGTGTLNVSGTGTVVSNGTQLLIGGAATANGTVNLNGGTLTVKQVTEGPGGNSEFHFNGGLLKANTGANANFLTGLDAAFVKAGGAFVDSNGQTITIAQNLVDGTGGGGLSKSGAGTLLLNGSNSYTGTTTVTAGTLGGTGSVAGPLAVPSGGTIAPGTTAAGTFTSGAATIGGTYACDVDGANADKLAVNGALVISPGAVLDFGTVNAPTVPALVIASYTSLTGTFTVQDIPAGYQVVYNYNDGISSNHIALVSGVSNPYQDWAAVYFPGVTDVNIVGPAADPDKDGSPNSLEFALGGVPNNGADRPKVFQLTADGSDADTDKELLVTIAVRGTPAFGAGPAPTATADGYRYTVRGSLTLGSFTSAVSAVTTPVAPPAPNATPPSGYVWRTFSLDGSNNLPGKGFMRVAVEEAP